MAATAGHPACIPIHCGDGNATMSTPYFVLDGPAFDPPKAHGGLPQRSGLQGGIERAQILDALRSQCAQAPSTTPTLKRVLRQMSVLEAELAWDLDLDA